MIVKRDRMTGKIVIEMEDSEAREFVDSIRNIPEDDNMEMMTNLSDEVDDLLEQ